jgi:hypothetical protein
MTDTQAEAELMRLHEAAVTEAYAHGACAAAGSASAQHHRIEGLRIQTAFRTALSAFAHARQAERWQPIETAPRDGTPVLVCRDMGNPWGWVRGWSRWVDVRGISGWLSHGMFDVPGDLGLGNPTHWQPLPVSPPPSLPPDPETKP